MESKPKLFFSIISNQRYFAVSVLRTSKNILNDFKGSHEDITTWTPYLVVAYLGFASCERNM